MPTPYSSPASGNAPDQHVETPTNVLAYCPSCSCARCFANRSDNQLYCTSTLSPLRPTVLHKQDIQNFSTNPDPAAIWQGQERRPSPILWTEKQLDRLFIDSAHETAQDEASSEHIKDSSSSQSRNSRRLPPSTPGSIFMPPAPTRRDCSTITNPSPTTSVSSLQPEQYPVLSPIRYTSAGHDWASPFGLLHAMPVASVAVSQNLFFLLDNVASCTKDMQSLSNCTPIAWTPPGSLKLHSTFQPSSSFSFGQGSQITSTTTALHGLCPFIPSSSPLLSAQPWQGDFSVAQPTEDHPVPSSQHSTTPESLALAFDLPYIAPTSPHTRSSDRSPREPKGTERVVRRCSFCIIDDKLDSKDWKTGSNLERHVRSVHGVLRIGAEYWICTEGDCGPQGKVWPRLDNFLVHLKKKHHLSGEIDSVKYRHCAQQAFQTPGRRKKCGKRLGRSM